MTKHVYGAKGARLEKARKAIPALRRAVRALEALAKIAYALDADADANKYQDFLEVEIAEREFLKQ